MSRAHVHYIPVQNDEEPDLDRALQDLQGEGVELRRGDLVLDSTEWRPSSNPDDPRPEGSYRHDGIYIYDGTRILPLNHDGPDDYGSIPEQFQVITEFPTMYWSHVLNHSSWVPFDFREHLGQVDAHHVAQIRRRDGQGSHLVYQFLGPDEKAYGIVDLDEPHPNPDRLVQFLQEIQDQKHFQTIYSGLDGQDPLSLPRGLSYEQFLLHSNDTYCM